MRLTKWFFITEADVLTHQITGSERLRAKVLAILFLIAPAVFLSITRLFWPDLQTLFHDGGGYWLSALMLTIALYEFGIMKLFGRLERLQLTVPHLLRYWNAFVEISVPSIGILIIAGEVPPLFALVSPITAVYFFFIIVSTLRLDLRLSAFTGAMAGLQYLGLAIYFLQTQQDAVVFELLGGLPVYTARAFALTATGVVAGIIGRQIRLRVNAIIEEKEKRQTLIDMFGQQVSQPVAEELMRRDSMAGERRPVTVMFLDVRDFTPFAEQRPPEEIVAYLNSMFDILIGIVDRHHGIVNQFLGDGFMATFGAPLRRDTHARDAVQAALEILQALEEQVTAGSIPPTRLGMGIHSGEAVTGNIGSTDRRQYSITGSVVIIASRIEQLCKQHDARLLVSEAVYDSSRDLAPSAEALGSVTLKGLSHPLAIYRLA